MRGLKQAGPTCLPFSFRGLDMFAARLGGRQSALLSQDRVDIEPAAVKNTGRN